MDKTDYKTFLVELSFTREYQEHGTYPIHAKDEEHAKEKILALFSDMKNVQVYDVHPVPPEGMIKHTPDEEPTIN